MISLSLEDETITALDDASERLHMSRSGLANLLIAGVLGEGHTVPALIALLKAASSDGESRAEVGIAGA